MTSSLSPRTFRPAEHHASRMPGVLSATAVLLTLCLSACGGGGSGSGAPDSQGAGKGTTPPLSVNPGQPDTGNDSGNGNDGGNAGGSGNTVTPPDARTPPTSTPPTSAPPASTPPASAPPASTPPASTPPASTPPTSTPPVVNKASVSDLCKTTLANFSALTAGQDKGAMPNTPRPAMGVATEDPTYHSCVTRLTDNAEKHPVQPLRVGDGTRLAPNAQQAFNANDSAFLLRTQNGEWHIYSPQTGKAIRKLTRIAGDAEPQWDPKDPNVLYYMNGDGEGMKLFKLTIDLSSSGTDTAKVAADFGAEIRKIWPTATHARMRGGAPSFDGNTWCLMADQKDGNNWKTLGLFTWNLKEGKLLGKLANAPASPEYVTTSPSGSHCVAQYPYSQGITAYRSNFATPYSDSVASQGLQIAQNVYMKYPDVARNSKGEDVYVGFDVFSTPHTVYTVNLTSGKSDKTTLLETGFDDNTDVGVQISGRASNKPGWILLTTFGEQDQGVHNLKGDNAKRRWFHRKLFAMNIDTKAVLSVANDHHDWTDDSSQNKTWPRPNGTVNRDFTRMLFDSNWNSMNANDVDAYLVEIPSGAVPAAAGASQ